jgi:hypothetical protein
MLLRASGYSNILNVSPYSVYRLYSSLAALSNAIEWSAVLLFCWLVVLVGVCPYCWWLVVWVLLLFELRCVLVALFWFPRNNKNNNNNNN